MYICLDSVPALDGQMDRNSVTISSSMHAHVR